MTDLEVTTESHLIPKSNPMPRKAKKGFEISESSFRSIKFGTNLSWRTWNVKTEFFRPKINSPQVLKATINAIVHTDSEWAPLKVTKTQCCQGKESFYTCTCGVYSYKEISKLPNYVKSFTRFGASDGARTLIVGELESWGMVTLKNGIYRSEFGYPKRIICPEESTLDYEGLVYRLASDYGIKVLTLPISEIEYRIFGNSKEADNG